MLQSSKLIKSKLLIGMNPKLSLVHWDIESYIILLYYIIMIFIIHAYLNYAYFLINRANKKITEFWKKIDIHNIFVFTKSNRKYWFKIYIIYTYVLILYTLLDLYICISIIYSYTYLYICINNLIHHLICNKSSCCTANDY